MLSAIFECEHVTTLFALLELYSTSVKSSGSVAPYVWNNNYYELQCSPMLNNVLVATPSDRNRSNMKFKKQQ